MNMRRLAATALLLGVPWLLVAQAPAEKEAPAPEKKAGETAARPSGHPVGIEPLEDCITCHAELTPAVHAQWYASRHGLNNVKCFVCHGSPGSDFMKKPPPERCLGCHAEQVQSLAKPHMQGKDCFACHTPHALSPHRH